MKGDEITLGFVTENGGKYDEASHIAARFGIRLKQIRRRKAEIQSDRLQDIACFAAQQACLSTSHPVITDDSGFFIRALKGFPGPYSAYTYKTIGNTGILRLLSSANHRSAYFQSAVAFCKPQRPPTCFTGVVKGTISRQQKGTHGFGFDPIFIPQEGDGRTFAQMRIEDKNKISHRARALVELFEWLTEQSRR